MKKLLFSLLAVCGALSLGAQTYTDITPGKFDFNKYETGKIGNFWDYSAKLGHNPALDANNSEGFFKKATTADFTDGYAYFYFNQDAQPGNFTYIENVPEVGNILKFGDSGHNAGFGGFFFAPKCEQQAVLMRTTVWFRVTKGEHNSNTGANLTVGIRNLANEGPDVTQVSYSDLSAAAKDGKWYKAEIEYNPTYALRVNYAQMIWGDFIEIAKVKFETVTDVPEGYTPVKSLTCGTPEETGLVGGNDEPGENPGEGEEPGENPGEGEEPGEVTGELTYTDITPGKFDFSKYPAGSIDNFWNAVKQCNHGVAGNATDPNGVISVAQAAGFEDGFAYFYFNQPTDPNTYTSFVDVEGVGNVLQFGDAGMGAGFGGCYFLPSCTQSEGYMRSTFVYRVFSGDKASNEGASMNVGVRNTAAEGPDLPAVSYTDLLAQSGAGNWYKAVVEYCPTYALRVNFAQLIWGDVIQVAQVKFESMTNVPKDYEPIKAVTSGTAQEVGILKDPSSVRDIQASAPAFRVVGSTVTFDGNAVVYNAAGAVVAQGASAKLRPGLYIANVNGRGVKFVIK